MVEKEKGKEYLDLGRRIIVVIGPEASGKSTVAKRLAEESGKPRIYTGGLIDDLAKNDPGPLGDECRKMKAERTYLKGETLIKILTDRLQKEDCANGFIVDGGLRTLPETQGFQKMLEDADRAMPLSVLHLDIDIWESYYRLISGPNAGTRGREDDTKEGLTKRLSKFYFQLPQRLDVIRHEPTWELIRIDATPNAEQVYETVVQNLL